MLSLRRPWLPGGGRGRPGWCARRSAVGSFRPVWLEGVGEPGGLPGELWAGGRGPGRGARPPGVWRAVARSRPRESTAMETMDTEG